MASTPSGLVCDVLIIGAGIVGLSTAHYLKKQAPQLRVVLADAGQPMAFTSAQSGENYRNWWPHPVMTAFTDHSIDLMEEIAIETGNAIGMSRRGYALATRCPDIEGHLAGLEAGYADSENTSIRIHEGSHQEQYFPPITSDWREAPSGVDVLTSIQLIRETFPSYAPDVRSIIHIRRAGAINAQQLGQYMLDKFKAAGGKRITGTVESIESSGSFDVHLANPGMLVSAERLVNAAGPFLSNIASMLGIELPVRNTLQQKIAFEDTHCAIPRAMPFSIDLDEQVIDWDEQERELLLAEPDLACLTDTMPGAIHCRPDGGDRGTWVKLGWAYDDTAIQPSWEPELSDAFPEIVLRGAARLNPSLKKYYERFPRNMHHYGGYYTMTGENWPLIGEMGVEGAFMVGAMSGFGTMAACAGGDLCAQWVTGADKPGYATALSADRYKDPHLMAQIAASGNRGIL